MAVHPPIPPSRLRNLLLTSVSAGALMAFSAGTAQAQSLVPGTFLSLEGGAACAFGDDQGVPSGPVPAYSYTGAYGSFSVDTRNIASALELGSDGCGWTGRIGFGSSQGNGFFGLGDSWGLFVRHSDMGGGDETASATAQYAFTVAPVGYPAYTYVVPLQLQGTYVGEYDEKRTVVDFEVGQDIGIGEGSKTRVFGGVRYARFKSETRLSSGPGFSFPGYPGYYIISNVSSKSKFDGVGPRIGVQTNIPITPGIGLSLGASGSALFGRRRVETLTTGQATGFPATSTAFEDSDTTWVGNVDGEAALTFLPFGNGNGQFDVGVRAEGWFRQADDHAEGIGGGNDLDRHNWGPFARFTVNLNGP